MNGPDGAAWVVEETAFDEDGNAIGAFAYGVKAARFDAEGMSVDLSAWVLEVAPGSTPEAVEAAIRRRFEELARETGGTLS